MPLEPVPLATPVDVRGILNSLPSVPLRSGGSDSFRVTVSELFTATPLQRRTGYQISQANIMDKAVERAQQGSSTLHVPLETERIIGLYFAASWNPASKKFTPELSSTYSALKKVNRDIEFVFCSFDTKDPEKYLSFSATMPWPRLPFRDPRIERLAAGFGIKQNEQLPQLVLIRARDNGLITKDAKSAMQFDPLGKKFPWHQGHLSSSWIGSIWLGLSAPARVCFIGVPCYCAIKMVRSSFSSSSSSSVMSSV